MAFQAPIFALMYMTGVTLCTVLFAQGKAEVLRFLVQNQPWQESLFAILLSC